VRWSGARRSGGRITRHGILEQIVAHKREELDGRRRLVPLADVRARAAGAPPPRPFLHAIRSPHTDPGSRHDRCDASPRMIAEVKGASPSAGTIREELDPAGVARSYAAAGAAAVSVLTDARFFHGADEHLIAVRRAVDVPVLRKDFVLASYQVYEARAIGADAVLLIVSVLSRAALEDLQGLASQLGMAALVEVHTEQELAQALDARPSLVGINNRDLDTLETSLDVTRSLRPMVPPGIAVVSESGIEERRDVEEMARLGVDAVLVGTALMRAPDPAARVRELLGRVM
jgi:indole-3-glycerol phosphate synthase